SRRGAIRFLPRHARPVNYPESPARGPGLRMARCPRCFSPLAKGRPFCSHCGAPVPARDEAALTCPKCGEAAEDPEAKFCWKCGAALPVPPSPSGPVSQELFAETPDTEPASSAWLVVSIGLILVVAALLGLMVTGADDSVPFLGHPNRSNGFSNVTIVGFDATISYSCSQTGGGTERVLCANGPTSGAPGTTLKVTFPFTNLLANLTIQITAIDLGGGFQLSSVSPTFPQMVLPGSTLPLTLAVTVVPGTGVYVVPATVQVTVQ